MTFGNLPRDARADTRVRRFMQAFKTGLETIFDPDWFVADSSGRVRLRNSVAVSVIGRSANSAGEPADIAAAANDRILSRTSDALGFTQLTVGMAPNDVWTYAKIQNVSATDRLLGRDSASAGDIEELTVGGGIEFTGSGGIQTTAFTGDVTKTAGGTALTVASNAVTYAKMQDVSAASRLLGRGSASAGDPEELTVSTGLQISGTALSCVDAAAGAKGVVLLASAVADASQSSITLTALTNPGDSPASADALRDDLVANVLPSLTTRDTELETAVEAVATKLNDLLAKLRTAGVLAT